MAQSCDIDLWVMKGRSAWPIFHSPVILPNILKIIWCMYITLWDCDSVWPKVWPQNKCRSLWPCILKTLRCILIWDYESVWPDIWPQNNCRSLWPIFHGPVILHYIFKTIWYMNTILLEQYDQTFDRKIFHGPVILPYMYILRTIWFMYIIFWDYESVWPKVWPQNKCVILTYILWSSDFALYLEDYLMCEHHYLRLWFSMTRCLTSK